VEPWTILVKTNGQKTIIMNKNLNINPRDRSTINYSRKNILNYYSNEFNLVDIVGIIFICRI
jgi:hypothetical protein